MQHIAILGCGTMGSAFLWGLRKTFNDDDLSVCDPKKAALQAFGLKHVSTHPDAILGDASTVLFAVKPQSFDELMKNIATPLEGKLVISIMAGVRLGTIAQKTGSKAVVRSMPNLGAQVGRSMTAWIASKECSEDHKTQAKAIFEAVGTAFEIEDESMLDAFTALAGSGPGYFFYLAELLSEKAKAMGFSEEQAEAIGREALIASARLLEEGSITAKEWKEAVTSKGGTTEAALNHLKSHGFDRAFLEAIEKAKERSQELSGQS